MLFLCEDWCEEETQFYHWVLCANNESWDTASNMNDVLYGN